MRVSSKLGEEEKGTDDGNELIESGRRIRLEQRGVERGVWSLETDRL